MGDIHEYLVSFPWAEYAVLYGLAFRKDNVDATIHMATSCAGVRHIMYTRCLFNALLAQFILNREDIWEAMTTAQTLRAISLDRVAAIQIEIDIGDSAYDHMFTLANLGTQWYIIQSYIYEYEAVIEPIDAKGLLSTIHRWQREGVVPTEWEHYFHVLVPVAYKAVPHIYATDRLILDDIYDAEDIIDDRIEYLLSNKDTYIHQSKYMCMLHK